MKEQTRRQVNVLGIDVSVMRPEKAVNITMNYTSRKESGIVYFHSAASSLFAQSNEWAAELIQSCDLVFAGDRHMEDAVAQKLSEEDNTEDNADDELFADAYIKHLLLRLNKDQKEIFIIAEDEERLQSLKGYMSDAFPEIIVEGTHLREVSEKEAGRVVNEINGVIPDLVFICLKPDIQLKLIRDYQSMTNARVIIGIESLLGLVRTETAVIPEWIHRFHLEGIYRWFKDAEKLQERIIGSIFRQKVLDKDKDPEQAETDPDSAEQNDSH